VGVGVVDGGVVAQPAKHATTITRIPTISTFLFIKVLLRKNEEGSHIRYINLLPPPA
jgi:hypothetical protein